MIFTIQIGALIITPTRELAMQIHSVLSFFIINCPHFTHLLLIGGTDPKLEQEKFSKDGSVKLFNVVVCC